MTAFAARPLDTADLPRARELAAAVGVHGIYLGNALGKTWGSSGDVVGFYGTDDLLGLAYFGSRGNLIIVEASPLDPAAVAAAVLTSRWSWRIALGPRPVLAALAEREPRPPLVEREQLYYGVRPEDVPREYDREDVRCAERADQAALLQAALDLNESDLRVDRRRVHKPWLRESIRRRVRTGQTMVIGPPGKVMTKLDVGSEGPFGMMVEGVYTFPEYRGQGLARALVATVARRAVGTAPMVCLHVDAANDAARRAYEQAGMTRMQECGLLLRG